MVSILDSVNSRTQMVGHNRLELLLFHLVGQQRYGINVFKIREVMPCPKLTTLPNQNKYVQGIAHIRGQTISVIDLCRATESTVDTRENHNGFLIITEYNRSVQGFLVSRVDRIISLSWADMMPAPKGTGKSNYLTAVTEVEGEMVSILDVEKILSEINPVSTKVSEGIINKSLAESIGDRAIMVIDDSSVARNQVKRALEPLGLNIIQAENGRDGLKQLTKLSSECEQCLSEKIALIISDIEMPEMDGYTLATEIKSQDRLKKVPLLMHTSLSGVFNNAMVNKVGADDFIPKFQPDELAKAVNKWLKKT